jgi:pyrroline-5-carboxylate reductase
MLGGTGQHPNELIAQVVSKGGTTEAGLKVLKKFKVERGIQGAVVKAAKRAREIGRGFK